MTDYGIKVGYYKFSNESNDNGTIVDVLKATPKFVWCQAYKYFDNIIKIDISTRIQHHHISGKKKKIKNGTLYPYDTDYIRSYTFSDAEYSKHIDGFDTKEEPVEPVVDPSVADGFTTYDGMDIDDYNEMKSKEWDEEELQKKKDKEYQEAFYSKEIDKWAGLEEPV
tara:strand:+ start:6645 stop:7145 length:501 start_codon:yes stop_codon:yes gene_type:complete